MIEDAMDVARGSALPAPLRRRLVERLGWGSAVAAMAGHGFLMATGRGTAPAAFALPLVVVGFFAVPIILRRGGSTRTAALVLLAMLLVAMLGTAALTGGLEAPQLAALPALVVVAVMLAGLRAAAATLLAGFAGLLGLGLLSVAGIARGEGVDATSAIRVLVLLGASALVLVLARTYEEELAGLRTSLRAAATSDPLTGLANRDRLDDALAIEHHRMALEAGSSLAVILFGIDDFDEYGETYGRQAADELVRRVAETARLRVRRAPDLLGRHGDDEMLAVLPATGGADAAILAECIRRDIEALELPNSAALRGLVTVSLGVAAEKAGSEGSIDSLLSEAGHALRQARLEGRNRVAVAAAPAASS